MTRPRHRHLATIACLAVVTVGASCGGVVDPPPPQLAPEQQQATGSTTGAQARPRGAAPVESPGVVVAAVGDIAGAGSGYHQQTSDLAVSWRPSVVLALGDLQYPAGELADFRRFYAPTWGRLKARTRPAPGNHDYGQPRARGYKDYFGVQAKPNGHTYYSFDLEGWHLVALNSEIAHGKESAQLRWLREDLSKNRQRCVLAYWHRPRFSSGKAHGPNRSVSPFWAALYAGGADVVLNGHEHHYERFARQSPGTTARTAGIRQFVVGTGGKGLYSFGSATKNSQVRLNKAYGVLKLRLRPTRYQWRFVSVDRVTRDSGSTSCH